MLGSSRAIIIVALIGSFGGVYSTGFGRSPGENDRIVPLAPKVPARMPDVIELLSAADVHLDGWIGARIDANVSHRLLAVDTEPLLAGYRTRPGSHPWIGEHVGKWLHAATLAWAYTHDPRLREKIDRVAAELIRCQEPDGYLGTYVADKRFGLYPGNDWDVWSHKYNLIGLMTYYQYTGEPAALQACCKMADLLIATFPTKKSILAAGTHVGMAATSVLEPIVLVYRATGDERYLRFARYLVNAWDEPGGPKIAATLLSIKQVNKTANAKAYEMLSNLVGLCELARATGDRRLLQAAMNAWDDITAKRLYLTGSASSFEHFRGDYELPNGVGSNICETCVTVTWMQLNLQLLRLTGAAKYGDEFERSLYNHLAAAQHPRGDNWCYYTALEGEKHYDTGITCCHSSGPRGMALAPQAAYLSMHGPSGDSLLVSTLETSRAKLTLSNESVEVLQQSRFPTSGQSDVRLRIAGAAATFGMKIRIPRWAAPAEATIGDETVKADAAGWLEIPARSWKDGDRVAIKFALTSQVVRGTHGNAGRAAATWGPFVLAFDQTQNSSLPVKTLQLVNAPLVLSPYDAHGLRLAAIVLQPDTNARQSATLVPFADAGSGGGEYRVWLKAP